MFNQNVLALLTKYKKASDEKSGALSVVKTSNNIMGLLDSAAFIGLIFAASFTLPYFIATVMITGLLHRAVKASLASKLESSELKNIDKELSEELEKEGASPTLDESRLDLTRHLIELASRKNIAQRKMKITASFNEEDFTDEDGDSIGVGVDNYATKKIIAKIRKELKSLYTNIEKVSPINPSNTALSENKVRFISYVADWLGESPKQLYSKLSIPVIVDFYLKNLGVKGFKEEVLYMAQVLGQTDIDYAEILMSSKYKKENLIELINHGYKLKACDFDTLSQKISLDDTGPGFVNKALTQAALNIHLSFPGSSSDSDLVARQKVYLQTIWDIAKKHNLSAIDDVAVSLNLPTQKEWSKNKKSLQNAPSPKPNDIDIVSESKGDASASVSSLPSNPNVRVYNGMGFDFESTSANIESQKKWNQTVEILNYFDSNPKAFDSLALEHQMSLKQVKTLTLPQLYSIYTTVHSMPSITKMGLIEEIDHTLSDTHALLEGIMNLSATSVLQEVQGLKLYANKKRNSLG